MNEGHKKRMRQLGEKVIKHREKKKREIEESD